MNTADDDRRSTCLGLKVPECEDTSCIRGPADSDKWWAWAKGLREYGTPADLLHAMRHAYACGKESERAGILSHLRSLNHTVDVIENLCQRIERGEHEG